MSRARRCPYCKRVIDDLTVDGLPAPRSPHAPFCSERCKLADLQKWLGGAYAIAGRPLEEGELPPPDDDE